MSYEMLIRRAFNCPSGSKHGAHQQLMQNAMTMEHGKTYAKHLGSFSKQFNEVKGNVEKALAKLGGNKELTHLSPFFKQQSEKLLDADNTTQLLAIIKNALDKVPRGS